MILAQIPPQLIPVGALILGGALQNLIRKFGPQNEAADTGNNPKAPEPIGRAVGTRDSPSGGVLNPDFDTVLDTAEDLINKGRDRNSAAIKSGTARIGGIIGDVGDLFDTRRTEIGEALGDPFSDELRNQLQQQLFGQIERDKNQSFDEARQSLLSRGGLRSTVATQAAGGIQSNALTARTNAATNLLDLQNTARDRTDRFREALLSQLTEQEGDITGKLGGLQGSLLAGDQIDPLAVPNILGDLFSAQNAQDFTNRLLDIAGETDDNEFIRTLFTLGPTLLGAPSADRVSALFNLFSSTL